MSSKYVNAEKGSIIFSQGVWYVVVRAIESGYCCICDHANNAHYIESTFAEKVASLQEIADVKWDDSAQLSEFCHGNKRDIPYVVIVEVLSGRHDHRWILSDVTQGV